MKIIGLSGSIRSESLNTKLLRYLRELIPNDVEYEVIDTLGDVPFYNEDMEAEVPEAVVRLRHSVVSASGLFIATPEHNHSFSAPLKNAIDWLSRPPGKGGIARKPVAILGAAPGHFGTMRAQIQLRQVLHATNSIVVARPEVFIADASSKFDGKGRLLDAVGNQLVQELVDNLIAEIRKLEELVA